MKNRIIKRIFCLMLALLLQAYTAAVPAFAKPGYTFDDGSTEGLVPVKEILFTESFDGDISLEKGALLGSAPNTLQIFENNTNSSVSDEKFLSVQGIEGEEKNLILKSDEALKESFSVEFKFRLGGQGESPVLFGAGYEEDGNVKTAIEIGLNPFTATDKFERNLLYKDSSGVQKPLVDLTSSWRTLYDFNKWFLLHGDSVDWATHCEDWYTLKVCVDTEFSKYSVYLNGSLCVKDESFIENNEHSFSESGLNIPFMVKMNTSTQTKYEDITIYHEPQGRTTLYANDFNGYTKEMSWRGAYNNATQRLCSYAGVAGLGLTTTAAKGGYIYARDSALVTEYRDAAGGAFASGIRTDDDITIDVDFTVDSFQEDSYLDNYATVLALIGAPGSEGVRFLVAKDGKLIRYYYNRTVPYEPTILTTVTLDEQHHLTLYADFETCTGVLYVDGVMIEKDLPLLFNMSKKGTTGYIKNGEDIAVGLGYHKESPTTDVTYDNLRVYRDERETVLAKAATELAAMFTGSNIVKGNINLPSEITVKNSYKIAWSSDSDVISIGNDRNSATVTPLAEDQVVKLTASVTDESNEFTLNRSFEVVVKADDTITDISSLDNWRVEEGNPLLAENPTNEADKAILINSGDDAYTTITAQGKIIEASADLYLDRFDAAEIYLSDANGNIFVTASLDGFNLKADSKGKEQHIKNYPYPEKSWFNFKTLLDMTERCYDVYVDNVKLNNTPIPFDYYEEPKDNAGLARIGFRCAEGNYCVDNASAEVISDSTDFKAVNIKYTDENAEDTKIPLPGGKLSSVVISNTVPNLNMSVYAAVYDENGRLKDMGKSSAQNFETGVTAADIREVEIPSEWTDEFKVKVFMWDEENQKILPVKKTFENERIPTIYILGDSSAADYSAESFPFSGWGTEFKNLLCSDKVKIVNFAAENCTASLFTQTYLNEIKKRILPQDYLFIAFGYDDIVASSSEDEYKEKLQEIVNTANSCGAECVFITAPTAQSSEAEAYSTYTKTVAEKNNCVLLDVNSLWNDFIDGASNASAYYANEIDEYIKSDYRWKVSKNNPENTAYDAAMMQEEGRLSPQGAKKAAELTVKALRAAKLKISEAVAEKEDFSYSVDNGMLTVSGSGDMAVFSSFDEAPWAKENTIIAVTINEGITSVSTNAFTGFTALENIYLPESLLAIAYEAFPKDATLWGYNNSAAQRIAQDNSNIKFALRKLRILGIGNSHTHDYMNWRELIFKDLKDAGIETQIEFDYALVGGAQLYGRDILYVGTEEFRSHYYQGSNPNRPYYNTYSKLRDNTYDLVLFQDYRESVMDKYKYTYADSIAKVVRWIKNEQPDADVAWVSDWTDINTTGVTNPNQDRSLLRTQWENNAVHVMNMVEALSEDKPDFIVPMSTALQNARTSYLGSTYNASDCYSDYSNTDWLGNKGDISDYTILERDGTHCSYELGRYLVSAAVFAKVYSVYKNSLAGAENLDFFTALKTTPEYVTNGTYHWNGEMNDNHIEVICEAARNAIASPKAVTQSTYTVDPADGIVNAISGLTYDDFTLSGIMKTVNDAKLGIVVCEDDISTEDEWQSAAVTFIHGYSKKTVKITK